MTLRIGELDELRATVAGDALTAHEPFGLHAVQVVGQGGALDADRVGQVTLHPVLALPERHEDQPLRQRSAGLGERVVEGTTEHATGAGHIETDRFLLRAHIGTVAQPLDI